MDYIPNTDEDRARMLSALGLKSINELFEDIPFELKPKSFDLPSGKSELEVSRHLQALADKNNTRLTSFLGAGFYDHFIPPAIESIISRPEFYTSYTPYQAEISQGLLQSIYEYQSVICSLTGMEVANASLYDGGTALYEAAMMACRITKRKKLIVDRGVNPIYRKMLSSYTRNLNLEFVELSTSEEGLVDRERIKTKLDEDTACLILQNPNFFGALDNFSNLAEFAHNRGALIIISVYPISLGMAKSPGEMGADIAVGEGQSLGLSLSFGGPYLGLMATLKKFVRQMPGRIVGETVDRQNRRGFVLTLQTREQHIRREKATSNICSNESLCALSVLVYLSLVGKEGIRELANLCRDKAYYALECFSKIPGIKIRFSAPIFNEFVIELPKNPNMVIKELLKKGIIAGFPLGRYYPGMENCLLVTLTEKRTKEEIDLFVKNLREVLSNIN